jgi:hypothetical protein
MSGPRVTPRRVATEGRWSRPTRGRRRLHAGGNTCEQLGGADCDRMRCAVIVVGGVDWPRVPPFAVVAEVGRLTRRPRSRSGCLSVTVQALHSGPFSQVLSRKVASVDWWRGIRWWQHQWCEPSGCAVRRETPLVAGKTTPGEHPLGCEPFGERPSGCEPDGECSWMRANWRASFGVRTVRQDPSGYEPGGEHSGMRANWRAPFGVRTVRRAPFGVRTGRRAFRLGMRAVRRAPFGVRTGRRPFFGCESRGERPSGCEPCREHSSGASSRGEYPSGYEPCSEHSSGANRAASILRGANRVASIRRARTVRRVPFGGRAVWGAFVGRGPSGEHSPECDPVAGKPPHWRFGVGVECSRERALGLLVLS